jgi:alkylation response protein AidB-like acyl-CoA dehydrogenase
MDFALPGEDHPARIEFREWLAAHPNPTPRQFAESGFVAPHWPKPWGRAADPISQLVIDQEIKKAGLMRPENTIGIGWAGPTILHAGTTEQKERYLMPILSGEEIWCQLFSEPGSGSDLASLSTRATLDGDTFVVTGQKIWTTFAHVAKFGILLARTNPQVPKHEGISYLICPMDSPGIEIKPIVDMMGAHSFNQVFLDEVRIPKENLVGELNKGWSLAKVTLANERVSLSTGGSLWGRGPTAEDLINFVKACGGIQAKRQRQIAAQLYSEFLILKLLSYRQITQAISGKPPGAESSVKKALGDRHGQKLMTFAKELSGTLGMVTEPSKLKYAELLQSGLASWDYAFSFSAALTIGGGTTEVQKNIIAEKTLGLPKEIDPETNIAWNETFNAGKKLNFP